MRRLLFPLALCLSAALAACTGSSSPTLPVPPPSALSSAPDADGFVTITGDGAIEGAMVLAYNERLSEGVIGMADDMGEFSLRLRADVGDTLQVWQRVGTESGQLLTLVVPAP